MPSRSFRFAPPEVEPTPALAWVLRAAFAHRPLDELPGDPQQVVRLAEIYALDRRILARRGEGAVEQTLGPSVARRWVAARREVVARSLLVERLAERLAGAALAIDAPAVLLKGAALALGGHTLPGVRRMADVDVLVPEECEASLRTELVRCGFTVEGLGEPHHSPPLVDAELGVVELHTRLPGIEQRGGLPLTVEALRNAGLLVAAEGALEGLLLPLPSFLAAHVLSHALHQHGDSPAGYAGLRWIGDLLDLAASSEPSGTEPGTALRVEDLVAVAKESLQLELSTRELRAATTLCDLLRDGRLPPPRSDAGRLLHHSLAGLLDEHYRGALRFRSVMRALLLDRARLRHRIRQRTAVGGPRGGSPRSQVAYLARQLGRDLRSWTVLRWRRRARPLF